MAEAAGLLGYRYTVEAEVIGGEKLGRTLGYPDRQHAAAAGSGAEGRHLCRALPSPPMASFAMASPAIGRRPTVTDNGAPLLETFVFDFCGDLYGEICSVSFFGHLRDELKFDGLDPLVAQIRKDEEEARALLAGVRPLGEIDRFIAFS